MRYEAFHDGKFGLNWLGRLPALPILTTWRDLKDKRPTVIHSAFTLVELLMVIALMAILGAQLLPAVSRAKEKSRSVLCQSNLRQLGMGLRFYLDDSGGAYPFRARIPAANERGVSYWFDALAVAIPNAEWGNGIFRCPAYQGVYYPGEATLDGRGEPITVYAPCGSYAYNAAGRRQPTANLHTLVSPGLGFSLCAGQAIGGPIRERQVSAPADLYVLGDAPLALGQWGKVQSARLGGAADYNSFVAENATVGKMQHSEIFNMLFADTHTESVRPGILLGTNAVCRSRWNHDHLP